MKIVYVLVAVLAILILLGWIGLNVQPKSFSMPALQKTSPTTVPLPSGLPAPVERFYRTVYGNQIPVIRRMKYRLFPLFVREPNQSQ